MSSRTRQLDAVEIRVLGTLLEKEQTTPEACPLSVNALLAGCNQKTNREPVMELAESQVTDALERLRQEVLVWRSEGARTERWQQSVVRRWGLDRAAKALMTLLLLRGPQTAGELRARASRMTSFESLDQLMNLMASLMERGLVRRLAPAPGSRAERYVQLLSPDLHPLETSVAPVSRSASAVPAADVIARLGQLEAQVEQLRTQLRSLAEKCGHSLE